MKFEDVLPKLREGKKAQCAHAIELEMYDECSYWEACRIGIMGNEPKTLTLALLNQGGFAVQNKPSLPLWMLLDESWFIVED